MTPENWRFSSATAEAAMEGIALSHDAYAVIAAAQPPGADARRVDPAAKKVFVWLDGSLADCLAAFRRPGEGHSDVILRLAAIEREEAWHTPSDREGEAFLASALARGQKIYLRTKYICRRIFGETNPILGKPHRILPNCAIRLG